MTFLDPRIPQRIWEKLSIDEGGCWVWSGTLNRKGYGVASIGKMPGALHRKVYQILRAPIPHGLVCDHLCRNRACVNPDHIEPVTNRENIKRGKALITHCPSGHEYAVHGFIKQRRNRWEERCCVICCRVQRKRYKDKMRLAAPTRLTNANKTPPPGLASERGLTKGIGGARG